MVCAAERWDVITAYFPWCLICLQETLSLVLSKQNAVILWGWIGWLDFSELDVAVQRHRPAGPALQMWSPWGGLQLGLKLRRQRVKGSSPLVYSDSYHSLWSVCQWWGLVTAVPLTSFWTLGVGNFPGRCHVCLCLWKSIITVKQEQSRIFSLWPVNHIDHQVLLEVGGDNIWTVPSLNIFSPITGMFFEFERMQPCGAETVWRRLSFSSWSVVYAEGGGLRAVGRIRWGKCEGSNRAGREC